MTHCPECEDIMTKIINPDDSIIFQCNCGNKTRSTNEDTLIAEVWPKGLNLAAGTISRTIIENSSDDEAGYLVKRTCPSCARPVMYMIRIGANDETVYTCKCDKTKIYK